MKDDIAKAARWLSDIPEPELVVQASFLALLESREAFSEEACVPNDEAERFAKYVGDLMNKLYLLSMMQRGLIDMKWEPRDWTYQATAKGRRRGGQISADRPA